ncbi:SsrA-binding protein SmpB [[Mycoplasma] testudinis]|uniref:SsrA-binding protein SmpB n=1 Tax=[Mycoplasma] testudinis TaxID=33924 RepID=UPI0004868FFA|nr:SsrA-binding protein SmpB [[Mycoplasma] testudinis]
MKLLINNRKAHFKYEIVEAFEAGISLSGSEVKSLSLAHGNIEEAFVIIRKQEIFLLNMVIPKYKFNTQKTHEESRTRKLLMHKHEILKIELLKKQDKLTIIPLSVYWSKGHIKIKIALGRGKKKHDKRETLKLRDDLRRMKDFDY